MTVRIAHDFTCPWCWIGLFQARRLQKEFGVEIDWVGAELWPEELGWPEPKPPVPEPANRPATPTRLDFLLHIENMEIPKSDRPKRMRTHRAHLAVELAKKHGVADSFVEALYREYWENGVDISQVPFLELVADGRLPEGVDLQAAIENEEGGENILHFDDPAYAAGVYNVPTFFIGDERLAEQPYAALKAAMERALAGSAT